MERELAIRPNVLLHMQDLKAWLAETEDVPLEEMGDFFSARLPGYEAHMSVWAAAYRKMPALLPENVRTLLDLGAGTGLELDAILPERPGLAVTCLDLSADMLRALQKKHPSVQTVQGDYRMTALPEQAFDAVIAFETLHHLTLDEKRRLFLRSSDALRPGGVFLEADYIACCDEEETLLAETCRRKRAAQGIPDGSIVHFDTPLTLAHETALLAEAGFTGIEAPCVIDGACFVTAQKPAAKADA